MLTHIATAQRSEEKILDSWEFSRTDDTRWRKASVPGTIHTDLLQHHLIPDPHVGMNEKAVQWIDKEDWQYRTAFDVPADWTAHDALELELQGLDTYAAIYLNGQHILKSNNMFVGRTVDVKEVIRTGRNELRIVFYSPIKHDMPNFLQDGLIYPAGNDASDIPLSVYARKAPYHYGWDWGPRLVTSGIWRPVKLRAWDKVTIRDAWMQQRSITDEQAQIQAAITVFTADAGKYKVEITSKDNSFRPIQQKTFLSKGEGILQLPFTINQPKRWWPNGWGTPHLYTIQVTISDDKGILARKEVKIGLRTIQVINRPDSLGESFYLEVNGRPLFAKGANYIPQDNFLPRVSDKKYQQLFADMKAANFNMVRVWGGGSYENDRFYELADEQGMLVWQDFMFACTPYPSGKTFLANVKEEAAYNITRLRNHPSLALWCGNNEVGVAINNWGWKEGYGYTNQQWERMLKGYEQLFRELLPQQVATLDSGRFYFHSSPISNWGKKEDFTKGDNHYWGVWHGMEPFDAFRSHIPRFMSEYGFQSFPQLATVRHFAGEHENDSYSPSMLSHQKSTTRGNQAINTYMLRDYRAPKDFPSFLYLSQVLQAEGMKIAMEAHRQAKPYCMGSLYWQLNDCWPGPSWSGIDYFGRWKALHYYVRKAFAPVMISAVQQQDSLHTWIVSDELQPLTAMLEITVMDIQGHIINTHKQQVHIPANTSSKVYAAPTTQLLGKADTSRVICYMKLVKDNKVLSDNVHYFASTKALQLERPAIAISITRQQEELYITLRTDKLARHVYLSLKDDPDARFSDNYFDLLPGMPVTIRLHAGLSTQAAQQQLQVMSLIDTYKH
ncbi:glycoside hydrolase family 2 protein [Chitinophaga sp. MD30]|uniref:beta-mannosidase n=1 Tax=Chitinophaga sp. MD30 TaxID=2033437 RepID=UPI000BB056E9|nr:glycoside hydrolase family 2 protein [Chitinophaga sp. MD30]ASZ09524.1 glycoside hydrolase [Chitinophaga sp. MD30]